MDRSESIIERTVAVIPAYNAARHLAAVIDDVSVHIARERIIVVDDGSADDSHAVAKGAGALALQHEVNQGKGAALRTGIVHAGKIGCGFAITLDADGQHNPADIPKFIGRWVETGADIIVGNRMSEVADMPWIRLATNRTTSWVVSRLAGASIPDSQNGYRMISTELFARIELETTRYDTESEILIKAGRLGAKIASVGVETIYGDEESSINPFVDSARFFRMVVRSFFW